MNASAPVVLVLGGAADVSEEARPTHAEGCRVAAEERLRHGRRSRVRRTGPRPGGDDHRH
jgi:hypothetical protein